MNPKEMFENALKSSSSDSKSFDIADKKEIVNGNPKDLFENALKKQDNGKESPVSDTTVPDINDRGDVKFVQPSFASNPRDLFEQALKSADSSSKNTRTVTTMNGNDNLTNGHIQANRYAYKILIF